MENDIKPPVQPAFQQPIMAEPQPRALTEVEASGPFGRIRFAGKDIHLFVSLVGTFCAVLTVWIIYQHTEDAKEAQRNFSQAVKEQTLAVREQTVVQREQNCLISMPQNQRDPEFCRRISR